MLQTSTAPETNNGNPSSAVETAVSSTSKPSNAFSISRSTERSSSIARMRGTPSPLANPFSLNRIFLVEPEFALVRSPILKFICFLTPLRWVPDIPFFSPDPSHLRDVPKPIRININCFEPTRKWRSIFSLWISLIVVLVASTVAKLASIAELLFCNMVLLE